MRADGGGSGTPLGWCRVGVLRDAALTAGVLAAVAIAVPLLAPLRQTPASLAATLPAASEAGVLGAYLVAQPADCEGNLAFLALLDRPEVARRIRLRGILLAGSAAQARAVRARPALQRLAVPIQPLQPRTARALAALGARRTPYFVVLAPGGEVRLAVGAPQTPRAHVQLARLLTVLASSTE